MKSKNRGKHGSGSAGGESLIRNVFYLLIAMMITFFTLVTNKKWILSQFSSLSRSDETEIASANVQLTKLRNILQQESISESKSELRTSQTAGSMQSEQMPVTVQPITSISPQSTTNLNANNINSIPHTKTLETNTKPQQITAPSILKNSILCPSTVHNAYQQVPNLSESPESLLRWCQSKRSQNHVDVGRSWGSLSRNDRMEWDRKRCNELLTQGKLQTCDEQWGWKYFETWKSNSKRAFSSKKANVFGSNVTCSVDYKTSSFCEMRNARMDFSKMSEAGASRSFRSGFLTLFGEREAGFSSLPPYPGLSLQDTDSQALTESKVCDMMEKRPTFVLSNDDIFNLGHYINDVIGIWAMTVLSDHTTASSQGSVLINIDGYREGGPAGGPAHRLMIPQQPDLHGPFAESYYEKWFDAVYKAKDLQRQRRRICFDKLYVFPLPGIPWFWNDWGRVNDCSTVAASPLYQSFNVFLRQHLMNFHQRQLQEHKDTLDMQAKQVSRVALPTPPTDHIHVVIEVRKINPKKHGARTNSGRVIRNLQQLVAALEASQTTQTSQKVGSLQLKVTTQDFALLSFPEQIRLAHSASILVSMHGAGTTHIFHMALGQRNCCGLLELFPDTSVDLYTAQGYGNLARHLGLHHYRLVATQGATTEQGTQVDIPAVVSLVEKLARQVSDTPTCLHEVRDTT